MTASRWTPEMDELLRTWAHDLESSSRIARRFAERGIYVTRNAVVGRANRIKARLNSFARPKATKKAKIPRLNDPQGGAVVRRSVITGGMVSGVYPLAPVVVEKWGSSSGLDGLTFFELDADSCRWPARLDDCGRIELYCGATSCAGPYCAEHGGMALRPAGKVYVGARVR